MKVMKKNMRMKPADSTEINELLFVKLNSSWIAVAHVESVPLCSIALHSTSAENTGLHWFLQIFTFLSIYITVELTGIRHDPAYLPDYLPSRGVKVVLEICGSTYSLSILCLSSLLYTIPLLFPVFICFMLLPLYSFPDFSRFPASLSTPSALLSHPTKVQLMKLHPNYSNLLFLLHFWNLISESLSTMSLSRLHEGTSHRFLAVKEWQLLWNMTVVLIAQSTVTAGRLKESIVCDGQECDVEECASVNVSQGLSLSGSLHNPSWWIRKSICRVWLGKGGQGRWSW